MQRTKQLTGACSGPYYFTLGSLARKRACAF
jgi:hypothetical protein